MGGARSTFDLEREAMDVVVVGSCNTDLISYVPRMPRAGETVHGSHFRSGFGGKGANQCVMAARLGARAAMVAKVGDDRFGHNTVQNFKDNNINCDHVKVTGEAHSGMAPITVSQDGENSIVIVGGANLKLRSQDVLEAASLIAESKVVVCQLEVPLETTLQALRLAREHGVLTIFNPAPATALTDSYLQFCDIIVLNETEAELLSGHTVVDVASAGDAVRALLARGPAQVVITMGGRGVVFSEGGATTTGSSNGSGGGTIGGGATSGGDGGGGGTNGGGGATGGGGGGTSGGGGGGTSSGGGGTSGVGGGTSGVGGGSGGGGAITHIPAESVKTVDTTGAGDAFVGAMAYFLACHPSLLFREVVQRSGFIASQTTTLPGTQTSYVLDQVPHHLLSS